MEVYKTILSNSMIVDYSAFMFNVIDFLKEAFAKTTVTQYNSTGFVIILNKKRHIKIQYYGINTKSYKLVIRLHSSINDRSYYTTLIIPIQPTLTEELKEELEYFVEQYLTENDK